MLSHVSDEYASADELPQQRVVRDILVVLDHVEELEEREEPLCFRVLLRLLRDLLEQRRCVLLQDADLIDMHRVDEDVGFSVVREYVDVLTRPYVRPRLDRLLRRVAAELVVADDTSQHPGVCDRDAVVIVDVQLRQRADIYLELLLVIDLRSELLVQSMYAFDNDRRARLDRSDALAEYLLALDEIECRQVGLLA